MKLFLGIVASAAVAALLAVPVAFGAPAHWSTFKTPSGHIHCEYFSPRLRCDVQNPQFTLPAHDCHGAGDFGFAFAITKTGRGKGICAGDAIDPTKHVLHYGRTWKRGGITCHSHTTGLSCKNAHGHHFTLSQQAVSLG